VLVAGATGFIAQALFRCLETLEIPAQALVFTDREQLQRIPGRAGLEVHEAFSTDTASMEKAIENASPEIVVNLAAGGVRPDERKPDNLGADEDDTP
jgi:nucleoside-diphosphate-sugar epimerase